MVTPGDDHQPSALDVLVFFDELVLLAVLAVAGARLGQTTAIDLIAAIGLPLIAACVWGTWLAPRAGRRLHHPTRLVAKIALFSVAAALLATNGLPWWAALFWLLSVGLLTAGELADARSQAK